MRKKGKICAILRLPAKEKRRDAPFFFYIDLKENSEENTCRDGRAYDARHVGTHCVHEQMIVGVVFSSHRMGHSRRHRHGGYARRTDKRIDFAFGKPAHELSEQNAADGGEAESEQSQTDDEQRVERQKVFSSCGRSYRDAEQKGDYVHESVLRRVGKSFGDAALLKQVAEHEAAEQWSDGGEQKRGDDCHHNGENDFCCLGNVFGRLHANQLFLFGGEHLHQRRLNQRNQRHVGISRDRNRSEQVGRQLIGYVNSRRSVGAPIMAIAADSLPVKKHTAIRNAQ